MGDFGVVPEFSLTERSGRELKRADLAGPGIGTYEDVDRILVPMLGEAKEPGGSMGAIQ